MPSLGQMSSPAGTPAVPLQRSASINDHASSGSGSGGSRSSNRMVYSPNPPPPASPNGPGPGPGALPLASGGAWQPRPDPSQAHQYRNSPAAGPPPPQAGLMRRGMSYDSVYAPSAATAAPGGPAPATLLPTAYASAGRAPPPVYGGAVPVPRTDYPTSPSTNRLSAHSPASGPPHFHQGSIGSLGLGHGAPPGSSAMADHTRHASYSPSHYAAQANPAAAPPPASLYPHHIVTAVQASSPQPPPPQPPQPSGTPSHQPQAQQYYQSQAYYDATLQAAQASQQTSPNPQATQYYAGGEVLRQRQQGQGGQRAGFRKVRDVRDIKRIVNAQPPGRRADPAGGFISPLRALTTHLPQTYHLVNPSFHYETSLNPRRVLTKPSKPAQNGGFDNEDSDYILYVNDVLGPEDKDRYLILDVLGQGTFGQVVKCQNMKTHEIVAVKVVKNKPAYFQQSMMEVTILELINNQWDKDDEHHMLRLKDTFIHHSHLCLVFELLSNNLYELIKQNSFRGLSTSLVRVFTAQLLDALTVLQEAKIIHCDLKPENILLKSLQSPTIKVIDFGSACHEKQTVYTYIQSRFYRSPEVILSLPYSASIDMWSLGCICVELFLGLPLFPGTSEFNQITRIVDMLGMPPDQMLDKGKQTSHFFEPFSDEYGRRRWRLKTLERYAAEFKTQEQPSKKYFQASTLPEIIRQYPIIRKGLKEAEIDKEMKNRMAFIDFVKGLLHLDPDQRWSPQQARLHPFVLGEPFTGPFVPPIPKAGFASKPLAPPSPQAPDQKRYGGLPPAPQRSATRTYQDAKAYNQHLTLQQGYTAQAQQAAQRASQVPTNPYQDVVALPPGYGPTLARGGPLPPGPGISMQQQQQMQIAQQQAAVAYQQQQQQQQAYGQVAQAVQRGPSNQLQPGGVGPPPPVHHYTTRGRSNTLQQDLPPALQKLGPNLVNSGNGQSITPVLRREDQAQAWERMQGVGGSGVQRRQSIGRHPHLNLLQEQAESGVGSWQSPHRKTAQPAYGAYYQSPPQNQQPFSVVVDTRGDIFDSSIAAPPQAYSQANPTRYAPFSGAAPLGSLPNYGGYDSGSSATNDQYRQQGQPQPPPPQIQPSFYSSSVPASGFNAAAAQKSASGMDLWPR